MGYPWVEHTGEVQLEIEASTEEACFSEVLRALAELLADGPRRIGSRVRSRRPGRSVRVCSARWLEELVYRAETENLVPVEVERIELFEHGLHAVVRFRRGTPATLSTA
jgi:SHS2 domain-containing protein